MRAAVFLSFGLAVYALPAAIGRRPHFRRAEEGGEGEGNEIEQNAQFDTDVALQGGDVKQDTLFPPGVNGLLEIEFSNAEGRTLKVTENKTPPAPPSGFTALETSSYKVSLSGAPGVTLSKVDYIRNTNSTVDISQGQIGRLCTETNTFVIDPALGELEFEAEENELTLTVKDMNAEWGIFLPKASAATPTTGTGADTATDTGGAASATAGTGGTGAGSNTALLDLLKVILGSK